MASCANCPPTEASTTSNRSGVTAKSARSMRAQTKYSCGASPESHWGAISLVDIVRAPHCPGPLRVPVLVDRLRADALDQIVGAANASSCGVADVDTFQYYR